MRVLLKMALAVLLGLYVTACGGPDHPDETAGPDSDSDSETAAAPDGGTLDALYLAAIEDAVFADTDEVATDLIAVSTDDDRVTWIEGGDEARVLVVTWTAYPDSFPPGETVTNDWGDLWVTVSPELKDRVDEIGDTRRLRIAQLLGMPPDAENSHFAKLWVRPTDMFRPAPDNEITDKTCERALPGDAAQWYFEWYESNILSSYFPPAYPWTRLGYTYDWAPGADEQGLSELVVKAGSSFVVASMETTAAYLAE